jgi:uncharacterized coiled-coil protein SlyX
VMVDRLDASLAVLVKALKDAQRQIDELNVRVAKLESKVRQ